MTKGRVYESIYLFFFSSLFFFLFFVKWIINSRKIFIPTPRLVMPLSLRTPPASLPFLPPPPPRPPARRAAHANELAQTRAGARAPSFVGVPRQIRRRRSMMWLSGAGFERSALLMMCQSKQLHRVINDATIPPPSEHCPYYVIAGWLHYAPLQSIRCVPLFLTIKLSLFIHFVEVIMAAAV